MKSIILSLTLVCCTALFVAAQDYNKVQLYYMQQKFEDAKTEIDKIAADPKGTDKADTYLWKLNVYSEIYADSNLSKKYPDAGQQALEALNKYREKDNSLKALKENGVRGVGLLYASSFNNGRDNFTKQNWQASYDYFKIAEQMGDFLNKEGLSQNKIVIDTTTVLYTGYAAQNANKPDDAAMYYGKLADLKVGGKDLEDIYKFLLDYYTRKNDMENFKKYHVIAKELYPDDAGLWSQMEMINMSQNTSLEEMIAKYKQEDASGMTEDKYIIYAEAFASPDRSQLDKLDSAKQVELKLMAADAYKKGFAANSNNGLYAFNVGVLNYSIFSTLDERFYNLRGESAALKTQRAEITKEQQPYADAAVEWLEKGYTLLKNKSDRTKSESTSLNRAVDYLANLYLWKRDKSKGVNPKDYDAFDAKYKLYDAEHDKYKPQG